MKAKSTATPAAAGPGAPFVAMLKAGGEWAQAPLQQWFQVWLQPFGAGLRAIDAASADASRLREVQAVALTEGLARWAALQQEAMAAKSPYELWSCQCNWMLESGARAIGFWKELIDAATRANASLVSCMREEAPQPEGDQPGAQASLQAPPGSIATGELAKTALVTLDAAYGQMVRSSQQMMAAATEALSAGMRMAAPGAAGAGSGAAKG
jgi:hypothetical protein